jgi:hypothetical protein
VGSSTFAFRSSSTLRARGHWVLGRREGRWIVMGEAHWHGHGHWRWRWQWFLLACTRRRPVTRMLEQLARTPRFGGAMDISSNTSAMPRPCSLLSLSPDYWCWPRPACERPAWRDGGFFDGTACCTQAVAGSSNCVRYTGSVSSHLWQRLFSTRRNRLAFVQLTGDARLEEMAQFSNSFFCPSAVRLNGDQ